MSVTIVQYPKRIVTGAQSSAWVAAHNPIFYHFQRKDYTILSIQTPVYDDGTVKITLSTPFDVNEVPVAGDLIYLKAGTLYDVVAEVSSVVNSSTFYLSTDFLGSVSSGFINLNSRANYHLEIDIMGVDANNTYYKIGTAKATPDAKGLMKVDVHEWVKEMCGFLNEYDYATLNIKDRSLGGIFNIRYIERWQGNTTTDILTKPIADSTRMYWVNSAKQVADTYGQNMGVFVPFPAPLAAKAKFLTAFDRPTLFRGYPFDMQFIYSEQIAPYQVRRAYIEKDINDDDISAQTNDNLDATQSVGVNRLAMPAVADSVQAIELWLEIDIDASVDTRYANNWADDYDLTEDQPPIITE